MELKQPELTAEERAVYEWQMWLPGFGEDAQRRLKGSSVLITRCGGLGSPLAYSLAAAGVGSITIAHGGAIQPSDLNRQILMTHDWLGKPRAECAARRLSELNPRCRIRAVNENISEANAEALVAQADIVFDCAPLFEERFALNRACVRLGKPMVEAAMYGMECQVTVIVPGKTACLACIYPEQPPSWKRQFPVLGAVSALAAQIAAIEGIKLMIGQQPSLAGTLLYIDTETMQTMKAPLCRSESCAVCGTTPKDRV